MLEGIEVLNQTEIMVDCTWAKIVALVFLGIVIIGIIMFFVLIMFNAEEDIVVIPVVLAIVSFMLVIFFTILSESLKQPTGKYEYEVIIDNDKIDFQEFYNTYEIIEQRGDIFVIKEKEKK